MANVLLTEAQVKEKYPVIYEVFFTDNKGPVKIQPGESLHDFYTRRGLRCFCRLCIKRKK